MFCHHLWLLFLLPFGANGLSEFQQDTDYWTLSCIDQSFGIEDQGVLSLNSFEVAVNERIQGRIVIENCSDEKLLFYLSFGNLSKSSLKYFSEDQATLELSAGYAQPIKDREGILLPGFFPISLEGNQQKEFTFALSHRDPYDLSYKVSPILISENEFRIRLNSYRRKFAFWNLLTGILIGSMLTFLAYAIMNGLIYKKAYFGYYASYILFGILYNLHMAEAHPDVNLLFSYIPQSLTVLLSPLSTLSIIGYILFFLSFLEIKSKESVLFRYLTYLLIFLGLAFILDIIFSMLGQYALAFAISLAFRVIALIAGVWSCLIILRRKDSISNLIAYGTLVWLMATTIMVILTILTSKGVLGEVLFGNPHIVLQIGTVLELSIFTLAINKGLNDDVLTKIRIEEEYKALEERNSIIQDMYSNVTHEFLTPLTVIKGLNAMREGLPDHTRRIEESADRLLDLVNQLLALSKMDAGLMEMRNEVFDVIPMISGLIESFEYLASNKEIVIEYHTHSDSLNIKADPDKLRLIVSNLISNAIKYSSREGIVYVSARTHQDNLVIDIEDNGKGIPRHKLDAIFDKFFQIEQTNEGGVGIGLYIVKEFLRLMNGDISVQSELGIGSKFTIQLPLLSKISNDSKKISASIKPYIERNELVLTQKSEDDRDIILIVEDNPGISYYITQLLKNDYFLYNANNGQEGFALAEELIPDLILTDIMMPNLNGYEMMSKIRNTTSTCHIPIIALTAKTGRKDKIDGIKTGADAYLTKPFDEEELLAVIKMLITRRSDWQQYFHTNRTIPKGIKSKDSVFLDTVLKIIDEKLPEEHFSVDDISDRVNLERTQLYRKIKALLNKSPSDLIRGARIERASEMLTTGQYSIKEVAFKCGFKHTSYFSKVFKQEMGVTPSEYLTKFK